MKRIFGLGSLLMLASLGALGCRSMPNIATREVRPGEYSVQSGVASWYGFEHIGHRTAMGGWYNPLRMTAAHKKLPFGTVVRVTRTDTGQSVVVTINDRGPYVDGRIIDLARTPASRLNLLRRGIVDCKVEVLRVPEDK